MDEVLEHIKDGIRRFQAEVYPARREQYQRVMTEPQRPHALIVTCADSRLHPNTLTQAAPGEIFVARNIGNLVPPHGERMDGVSAVLEFSVAALGVRHIAVCGHTDCGAMKALLKPESVESMPSVKSWLTNAHAALAAALTLAENEDDLPRVLTEQNVLLQMRHLRTYPAVEAAMARGELRISGWVYDIAAGEVRICEDDASGFEPVGRRS